MAIKEYIVEITLHPQNIKHYENLGYYIPRYFNKNNNKMMIKRGTKIKVFVFDLPKGSHVLITAICECPTCDNPERILTFQKYRDICRDCYNHSEEHSLKYSSENNPMFGVIKKGQDAPNWKPEKTDEERLLGRCIPGITKWKKDVKERDNYTCRCCDFVGKKNDGNIDAHHLNNYIDFPEQRLDLDNGITLCINCHTLANGYSYHTIRGKTHNTKEEFFRWLLWRLDFENTEL